MPGQRSPKGISGGLSHTLQMGFLNAPRILNLYTGTGDEASSLQDGLHNQALVIQGSFAKTVGEMNRATIQQQGNDFQAAICPNGVGNRAGIRQH